MATGTLRGIHVFWWIFAFFAVTISVDVYFIVRAVSTFPGEQVKNSYVLGLDFNRQIERRDAQQKLGWSAEAGIVAEDVPTLIVRLVSATGVVAGLEVEAEMIFPGRGAQTVTLDERAPGEYVARANLSGAHRVELEITARQSGDPSPVFEASKTLEVRS